MRVGVRCGAARPAPVRVRGAARLATASPRATPASRCLQGAGRRARLDQGCAVRLAARAAAGPRLGSATPRRHSRTRKAVGGEAAQTAQAVREQAASDAELEPEEAEEEAAEGALEPDPLTVARLARPGWFKTKKAARALLVKAAKRTPRTWPSETAVPAADWLESMLGREPVTKDGLRPGAKAVKTYPNLLCKEAATLQLKWDALTLSPEQGGVGVAFSEEQAREVVRKHPRILSYAEDNLARGWSMLTATERGLGLSPEEARRCILRRSEILRFDYDSVMRRVALVKELGYADPLSMVLASPPLLIYGEEVVKEHAAWWKQTQLDHMKITTTHPNLLGAPQTVELQRKLSFLRDVAKLSDADLNYGGAFFLASLDKKLRPRFFYALKHGALERYKLSSLTFCSDALYLRMVHQLGAPANKAEIVSYKAEVASADFQAWAAQEEARRSRRAPEQTT